MSVAKKICGLTVLLLLCFISVLFGQGNLPVMAATDNGYSSVLDDLKKDSNFSESYYPAAGDDYSLQIIQLAESVNRELFVYVYQPCGKTKDFRASSINISVTVNDELSYYNYKMEYLNSSGVFYKYKVKDFAVLDAPTRYYAISSIYRPFDGDIDENAEHGNEITEVNYNVSKQYCFSQINGKPYCSVVDIETITITDKFVGFVRYKDGFKLYVGACDSHFVAFNTDKPIDKLLEADVYYTTQAYTWQSGLGIGTKEYFKEKSEKYAYLKYTDKVEHNGGGLFAGTYTWDRIETTEQFIAENDLTQNVYSGALLDVNVANKITDEGKAALQGKKWVLRFAETSYWLSAGQYSTTVMYTLVGDVTILRLKFETDGITYNLGVIDNKQSGSDKPINEEELQIKPNTTGIIMIILILLIILIIVFIAFVPAVLSLVISLFKLLCKFLLWLICAPFKLIGKIIKH
ncbi:MAG: hypothetical protein K2I30_03135 [Clostridia bacterium]|nr:hypothetical protein [Clostridia bacterium]